MMENKNAPFPKLSFCFHTQPAKCYNQKSGGTSVIDLFLSIISIVHAILLSFASGHKNQDNYSASLAFLAPLRILFPMLLESAFFVRCNNVFIWSAVVSSMSCCKFPKTRD